MSDDFALKVEGLSKKYLLRHQEKRSYVAFRDVAVEAAKSAFQYVRSGLSGRVELRSSIEEFWALQDVSFEVRPGDVVGIIGRNGAGKSTLLKVLSRITEPTRGRIQVRGRLASLLEVGTGFHPELTGRENIFLNGAILGMSQAEIRSRFDEIVSFAEIEKFLDTPVKRYSSGMYVRLAFAVAAHLEPEILIVDEVLAVGDAAFQKKCLGKMETVSKEGRAVLFVSHNMAAVQQLCTRAILLRNGSLVADGAVTPIVGSFLTEGENNSTAAFQADWPSQGSVTLRSAVAESPRYPGASFFVMGDPLEVAIFINLDRRVVGAEVELLFQREDGFPVLHLRTRHALSNLSLDAGDWTMRMRVDELNLYPGLYSISLIFSEEGIDLFEGHRIMKIEVTSRSGPSGDLRLSSRFGAYFVPSEWTFEQGSGLL